MGQEIHFSNRLADSGETTGASSFKLRLWLHESLLDLAKPVEVEINGKTLSGVRQISSQIWLQPEHVP